ncbi:hypothetical protein SteCoe_12545 [Stentor coeruleus]|uniref:Uncharacterized protein n=1 Tax=Stentor coeruleus TaxID=5963 RepID=A0A1R2CAP9_9CILI|nr:hypothetical protein SteCoe_12545 [Stentor coeruleus]
MTSRSKSVAKLNFIELLPKKLSNLNSIHEKFSSRLYGTKILQPLHQFSHTTALIIESDRPPAIYLHTEKSFDKKSQSSPAKRMQKLKEARLFRPRKSIQLDNKKPMTSSYNEISDVKREKTFDIVSQISQAVFKEKENENDDFLMKTTRDFSGKIQSKRKIIKKQAQKLAMGKLNIIKAMGNRPRQSQSSKRIVMHIK